MSNQIQAAFTEGLACHHKGQLGRAKDAYDEVLRLDPQHYEAWHLLGVIAAQSKHYGQAVELIRKSLALSPDNPTALANLGNALRDLGQLLGAVESYDKAITIKPDYVNALISRGIACYALKQYDAALDSYQQAISVTPGIAEAHYNLGNTLCALRRHHDAVTSYNHALHCQPDHVDAWSNRGVALHYLGQHEAAVESYDRALAIRGDHAEGYYNRGIALNDLKLQQAAIESYDKAVSINPDYAEAWVNRGNVLNDLKQYQAALDSYERAMTIDADYKFLRGMLLHTRMQICDWRDAESQAAELLRKIEHGACTAPPFAVLAVSASLPLQRKAAVTWVRDRHPIDLELGAIARRTKKEKTRLGYFSMDFRNHPVSHLTAGLFETHDRSKFEVYAFSFGPDTRDEMRTRLEGAFDRFLDVRTKSDRDIAALAREMEIDIAVDLAGFTSDSRTGIFALRAAPLQINYLGYPGTMAAPYMDYLIADRQVVPDEYRTHYAEKIVQLPSFLANDNKRPVSDRVFTREELDLPAAGFVFCCFNNHYKITPTIFDVWMRILKKVDGSVLWLSEENALAPANLRKEALLRGVAPQRLVFAKKIPLLAEHLARHRAADLFIDTLPYNAHTTASDALWAGLPVLTCTGQSFASRVAASLLNAIDLPELITSTQQDYEALAIELATNPERLDAIRHKLARNRLSTPLFDTQRFTRNIEAAYTQMVERYHAGLPPDHIRIDPA